MSPFTHNRAHVADPTESSGQVASGQYPAPTLMKRLRSRPMLLMFAALGPGLIAASAGNDAGGIVTYGSAGAEFVYRALFLMVLITVAYVVVQKMVARLAVFTGKGQPQSFGRALPARRRGR